ncbi:MAG: gamma-glutamyltransferase, partial [Bdellovibrionales bacterium]|nr:gamma-glutamyltransferase [Bdellovibrionales bacterium]
KTLEQIAKLGKDGFYKGEVAAAFLASQKKHGGLITQKDLDGYIVKKRIPVSSHFQGHTILSMPPPSSGGVHVIQILNIMSELSGKKMLTPKDADSVLAVHKAASAMQMAFADRAEYLGDSDYSPKPVPVRSLTSEAYSKKRAAGVTMKRARSSAALVKDDKSSVGAGKLPKESDETTHFTVMDMAGNVVSSTQTINGWFGAGLVAGSAGFMINNEMDDFSAKSGSANMFGVVGGAQNEIQPKKRPLSSMSPTVVLDGKGEPVLALGTASGPRIISCVALVLLNVFQYGMDLKSAVAAPRYHHQWFPDEIRVGDPSLAGQTIKGLEKLGYKINHSPLGCRIQAVARKPNQELIGVSDHRGSGLAIGL